MTGPAYGVDFGNPSFFPWQLDFENQIVTLRRMSRSAYSDSTFLDHRIVASEPTEYVNPEADIVSAAEGVAKEKKIHFIFHAAFCGSTLLCRCLDRVGTCLPFKEPWILHQLSFILRKPDLSHNERNRALLLVRASANLLSRTFSSTEVPVVKPTDSCGNLGKALLTARPNSVGLILYRPLRPFLASVLKAPDRRTYARGMAYRAQRDLTARGTLARVVPDSLSDARVAAFVWAGLMYSFLDLLDDHMLDVCSLNADVLLDYPSEVIASTAHLFDLSISTEDIRSIVEKGPFQWDSKFTGQRFDHATYRADRALARLQLADEITDAVEWLSHHTESDPIPTVLPHPLPT